MSIWKKYIHQITLNGQRYLSLEYDSILSVSPEKWEISNFDFIKQWVNDDEFIKVNTSGSTGKPKTISIHKNTFVQSAKNTGDYLRLKKGDKALMCLPGDYIAGKMMIVRAFVLGLNLDWQKPTSNPKISGDYDFSAMTPMQLQNIIKTNRSSINKIKKLIIGGAPVNNNIIDSIAGFGTKIYETYGMTETASHIALKPLNGNNKNDYFTILKGINIDIDKRNCLTIDSQYLQIDKLISNDIVEIKNNTFKWLGRADNIINSGGIKLIPEQIEAKLKSVIKSDFFIFGIKDLLLTEVPTLIIESTQEIDTSIFSKLLDKIEIPKKVFYIKQFVRTDSEKINRKETIEKYLSGIVL